jgi:HEAT repeat protein
MALPRYTLRQLHEQLCSLKAETRGHAMNRLVLWLEKDPSIGQVVLPMFRAALDGETDAWTAARALDGLELVLGRDAALEPLERLLARDDPVFVSRIALSVDQPAQVPLLLKLLAERRELPIRGNVIRVLGRSKDARAFDAIVSEVSEPKLREDVIAALGELGDPRGIPLVEPFLLDQTPIGRQDERGAMLYVSDLARDAIMMMKRNLKADLPPDLPVRV